jgi:hypothetical protein
MNREPTGGNPGTPPGRGQFPATADTFADADPGDLYEQIDSAVLPLVGHHHRSLSGGVHLPPDALEHLDADLLSILAREGQQ